MLKSPALRAYEGRSSSRLAITGKAIPATLTDEERVPIPSAVTQPSNRCVVAGIADDVGQAVEEDAVGLRAGAQAERALVAAARDEVRLRREDPSR